MSTPPDLSAPSPRATPVVGVGAVVVREGRLLVVRRGRQPARGMWTLPGGRLEVGERIRDGVARELREETGLAGDVGDLVGIAERIGDGHHFVIHDHWVDLRDDAAPVAADDADEVRFVTEAQLRALPVVPGTIEFLDEHGVLAVMGAGSTR